MTVATLDTNMLASGLIATGGTIGALMDAWLVERRYDVVLSAPIFDELVTTLGKPYFAQELLPDDIAEYLDVVRRTASFVAVTAPVPGVVRTRADNIVLATADTAEATHLVTGDRERQQHGRYRNVAILSPRQFLEAHANENAVET